MLYRVQGIEKSGQREGKFYKHGNGARRGDAGSARKSIPSITDCWRDISPRLDVQRKSVDLQRMQYS